MEKRRLTPREEAKQEFEKARQYNSSAKPVLLLLFGDRPEILQLGNKFFDLIDLFLKSWSESLDREEQLEKKLAETEKELAEKTAECNRLFV